MRYLSCFAFVFLLLVFSSETISAQAVNTARIKVNGVGLDSTYAQVVKALGKPTNEDVGKEEGCIGGLEKSIKYPGISFYLMDGDSKDGKTFEVKSLELTGPGYLVSGIKIGDSPATVRKKYGRKYTVDTEREPGEITWFYEMSDRYGPGTTAVVFKNGKVVKIASSYQVC
ncbi:MAG: hypothetical protein IPO41_15345 [Acidobacteria bacterium]|nr:hypothetical protein [Acidobacteriota bacterium]MBK9529645.1 hypothetical protein [Acidobacteriota bacterium]MBP7473710.1 hypothetical protein [Pyrinomonadaceae bacterium]MBP9108775.1 hypothetical protein [Pyrinomonadaceae bacterium]